MPNLISLQKEAEHSYRIYLECSGVLDTNQAKLALLKWPDVASAAINWIISPNMERFDLLGHELHAAVLEPIKMIHEAACDRFVQLTSLDPKKRQWYVENSLPTEIGAIPIKNVLIDKINLIFEKLSEITSEEYPEIRCYDNSSD